MCDGTEVERCGIYRTGSECAYLFLEEDVYLYMSL